MNIKKMAINSLVAAMYVVVTMVIAPFGFSVIQFRVSELFNHFIVFDRRYFTGIVAGVFLANLFLSPVKVDMIFGVAHTALSLGIVILISKRVKNRVQLMIISSIVFSLNMYIIAFMLKTFMGVADNFMVLYGTLAVGELVTMLALIPIANGINRAVKLDKVMEK